MSTTRLQELFEQAAALAPAARDALLARLAETDAALADRVRGLLEADARAAEHDPFTRPAFDHEARAIAEHQARAIAEHQTRAIAEHEARAIADDAARATARHDAPEGAPDTARGGTDPLIGTRIGAYEVIGVVGAGGMGTVYRATRADGGYDQVVALKCLKRGMDADQIIARFRGERQILATLNHPNIARLLDGGQDERNLPYLVMEFVEGVPPREYCAAHRSSIADRLRLFRQIADAVSYAHQRLVVHRDIKPGNILVTESGAPKLLDFGVAKLLTPQVAPAHPLTEFGQQLLTLRYASPEQVRGEPVTTAADVYALGVVLFELLTDQSPYAVPEHRRGALVRAVCETAPTRPSALVPALRGDLDTILLKALKKDPAERYGSVEQLSEDVRRHLEGLPIAARADSVAYRARLFVRRNRYAVAAAAAVFVALAASVVLIARAQARAERRFNDVRKLAHAVVFDYHDAIRDLPGATPVRQRMVNDALTYLDSLAHEADDAELSRELVDAYVRISDVQGNSYGANLGDTAGALVTARKAVAAADALLARDRSAPSLRSAAAAYAAEGGLLFSGGDLTTAGARYERAVALDQAALDTQKAAQKGAQQDAQPGAQSDAATSLDLAQHLRNLGDLYGGPGLQNLGRTDKAVEYYQRAFQIADAVAQAPGADAAAARERYETQLTLAAAQAALGRSDEAMAGYRHALALIDALAAANPNNALDSMERSNVSLRIGMLLMDDRRASDAIAYIDTSSRIMRDLIAADPQNTLYQRNLSVLDNHLARAYRGAGRPADALPRNEESLALATKLSEADPASAELKSDVAASERKLAETLVALRRLGEAVTHATRAIDALHALSVASPDASLDASRSLALLVRADARVAMGDAPAAVADARDAEALAQTLIATDASNMVYRSNLARIQVRCADALSQVARHAEARSAETLTAAARSEFQHALATWASLAAHGALTPEDAVRRDAAADQLRRLEAKGAAQ